MTQSNTPRIGNYRWTICTLIFFATTINYIDRQVIGLLKPDLAKSFNWTETDYANIVFTFQCAYAIGLFFAGRIIDKIGSRLGYAASLIIWSFAAMAHALAKGTLGFGVARALLGIGESANFPAAIKSVTEWFPKKERALATGIFNSGTNIGAVIAPIVVPWLALTYGWQMAFIGTGAIGFLWLIFWFIFYEVPEKQKRLSEGERDYILSDPIQVDNNYVSWSKILRYRQTWAFIIGKFLTDPIWWFYLFWLPSFLSNYGLSLKEFGWPLVVIYSSTTIGSIYGGWLSSSLIKKGWPDWKARSFTMLLFAILVVPVIFAQHSSLWTAITLISIAAASHQAWSANIFTTVSDMFPKKAVGTVIGIGGMAGAIGGMLISKLAGFMLDNLGKSTGYFILFIICGFAYIIAWLIFNLLAPKMKKVEF
jgi:ACS family hexuronate transporter-like MFS transporter